ncbi:S-layer homology domain-containing protein, partial [Paenibacillus sp. alder61]
WSFRTVDQTAPQMVSKSPEGSGAVLVSGLSMTFNEPVQWGTGDVIVHEALDGRIAKQVHVSGGRFTTGYGTLNGSRADLYLDGGLEEGTSYYVEVTPGTLTDRSGNPFAGILGSNGWKFGSLPVSLNKGSKNNGGTVTGVSNSVPLVNSQSGILVNAKKTTTLTEAGERTTLDINEDDLTKELRKNGSHTLMIDAAQFGSNIIVNLPMNSFRISEAFGNLRIGFGSSEAQYFLPAELIQKWAETYNEETLSIQITKLDNETKSLIQGMVVNEKAVQAEPGPTEFLVRAGQREISDFSNKYVERKLLLSETVSAKNSTAVWMNPETNRLHFVPSLFENEDGSTEVTIKTAHNSIYTVISADKKFSDMNGHWAYDDVELMANKLILQGVTPEKFDPNRPITRSEFVALIARGLGLQEDAESDRFSDVTANDWHAGSIGAAIEAGLVQGNENNKFLPNDPITREEIALIAERALEYVKGNGERESSNTPNLPAYKDEGTVSLWAKKAMNQAISQGLIQGKSQDTLDPKETATRAEAASVIKRLLRLLKFID